jgi:tetratricopeptide (TPR) repeat protein
VSAALVLVVAALAQVPRGDSLLARGRWDEAEQAYRRAAAGRDSLPARLGQARLLELRGRREEARRLYGAVLDADDSAARLTPAELLAVAMAAERLSRWEPALARDALRLYDASAAADPRDPEPRLRAASLLLSRYNGAEARAAFEDIRRRWANHPRALLGLAEVRRFLGDGDPVAPAESSLAADSTLTESHLFLARLALETDDWDGAARHAGHALALEPRSREAQAVRAALAFMRGDTAGFAEVDRAISADDPRAAEHLVASADAAARARRYAEAVRLAEDAVARDPTAWRGWALLGINRLRRGDMAGGRAALETAFRGDPYDLWTKNTLDLLDTLGNFAATASPRFRFVMDGREAAALTPYFAALAEEAYDSLVRRYGIRPATPIRVEVYARHADFSVRTVGLAGLGALGACFGPVIAMDSPSARDRGQFSWGSTLWHEIAHVFHLELSRYRVPRWLTEGLAVLEERRARPGWGDPVGPEFVRAWTRRTLPPPSRLNDGFIRPADAEALAHAYQLASFAAEWIESRWGARASRDLLAAFGAGLDTRTAVRRVLDLSLDSLDAAFTAWLDARLAGGNIARGREAPEAAVLRAAGRPDADVAALERALYVWPLDAALHERLADGYARQGRHELAVRERQAVIALGPADRAGAWYRLAVAHEAAGQPAAARRAVQHALELAPGYADAQDLLLRLAEGRRP